MGLNSGFIGFLGFGTFVRFDGVGEGVVQGSGNPVCSGVGLALTSFIRSLPFFLVCFLGLMVWDGRAWCFLSFGCTGCVGDAMT